MKVANISNNPNKIEEITKVDFSEAMGNSSTHVDNSERALSIITSI